MYSGCAAVESSGVSLIIITVTHHVRSDSFDFSSHLKLQGGSENERTAQYTGRETEGAENLSVVGACIEEIKATDRDAQQPYHDILLPLSRTRDRNSLSKIGVLRAMLQATASINDRWTLSDACAFGHAAADRR